MVEAEFSPMNCPLSPPSPVNCPFEMPSNEFKNHSRNIKYFLLKGNLDSRFNLAIYSSLIFVKVQQSDLPSASHRLWEIAFIFDDDDDDDDDGDDDGDDDELFCGMVERRKALFPARTIV